MLSFAAPLMIPVMIGVWTLGLVVGFALVYFGGLEPDDYFTGGNSQPDLANALRLSFVTLSTIGFVEISPSNMAYSVTVALEAILGSIIITLTVTYYLSVQGVLSAFTRAGTLLSQRLDVTDGQPSQALSRAIDRDEADMRRAFRRCRISSSICTRGCTAIRSSISSARSGRSEAIPRPCGASRRPAPRSAGRSRRAAPRASNRV